ncbi:hypothetical protein ACWC09_42835 [Streptomyces sp. NPDC001617]
MGNESPVDKTQNPVQYFDSPFDRTKCACGCEEEAATWPEAQPQA